MDGEQILTELAGEVQELPLGTTGGPEGQAQGRVMMGEHAFSSRIPLRINILTLRADKYPHTKG